MYKIKEKNYYIWVDSWLLYYLIKERLVYKIYMCGYTLLIASKGRLKIMNRWMHLDRILCVA